MALSWFSWSFPWTRESRNTIDGELATFYFHLWSPDEEFDKVFTRDLVRYDKEKYSDVPSRQMGRVELECRRLVGVYFPEQIELSAFLIEYDGSVTITFTLIAIPVAIYELISRYDNFRRSLPRLRDDVSRFLERVGMRSHRPGRIIAETGWTPGRLLIELEELRSAKGSSWAPWNVNRLFIWYLICTNIILAAMLFALVYHAVATMYFR